MSKKAGDTRRVLPPPKAVSDPSGLFYHISQSRVRQWRRLLLNTFFMKCPVIDDRPLRYSVVTYRGKKMIVLAYFFDRHDAVNYAMRLSAVNWNKEYQVLDCLF